ncbi:MAG: glycosyltransferase [Bacteroidetes bacterium]|nr:glycosyltransferase [Bacteroidota bacterium]
MNIIIIGPAHPLRGGLASYNERLAKAFREAGHDVSVFTFSLQYPGFLFPGTTQYSTEPAPTDLNIHVCINSVNPLNWIVVGRKLKQLQPDLIVVRYWLPFMGPCLGTILRIAKKNKKTKVVCIADNINPHEKRPGDILFTRYFVKPVDAFITMSEKVLKDLDQFRKDQPAKFVPHPLYDNFGDRVERKLAREKLGLPQDCFIFLFFGFIRKYKGLDLLLEATDLLRKQTNQVFKVLIAGEFYEDAAPYQQQIESLQIADSLILKTDFIADSEVKYFLCAADAVVQPYKNATQSGVTPLTYHFEIPMIVTRVGALPDMVPHGKVGLVCEPNSKAIAAAMLSMLQSGTGHFIPGLREEKQQYSWVRMVEEIVRN